MIFFPKVKDNEKDAPVLIRALLPFEYGGAAFNSADGAPMWRVELVGAGDEVSVLRVWREKTGVLLTDACLIFHKSVNAFYDGYRE